MFITRIYYIDTNGIPGELGTKTIIFARENNLLSSHRKMVAVAAVTKRKWFGASFIGVCIINRTLRDRLEIRHFSSRVEEYFT